MVQSLAGGSHHIPRRHQHVWMGMCSLSSDLGLMEWVMDTGKAEHVRQEGSSSFLYLESPIVSSPHCRLDKLGSCGFSLMPTPLGSLRALSTGVLGSRRRFLCQTLQMGPVALRWSWFLLDVLSMCFPA